MGENASENAEHIVVAQYLQMLPWVLWMHPANGGYRFPSTARLLKRMGVSPGVPDILIFTPGPISRRPLAIEMKSQAKTAQVSPAQRVWLARLAEVGWETHICRGASHALAVLRDAGFSIPVQTPGPPRTQDGREPIGRTLRVATRGPDMGRSDDSPGPIGLACSYAHQTPAGPTPQAYPARGAGLA